ncbi:MAG: glycoside hydrolase family 20 zincin-like fold domain-containing protein, partial [Planctomycetota bacterium]|nr:glycoside hydrolase family 20 zincin-like fold domain-containing protein [Planctomycetota bacterium]
MIVKKVYLTILHCLTVILSVFIFSQCSTPVSRIKESRTGIPQGDEVVKVIPTPRQIVYKSPIPCVLTEDWSVFVESSADETTRLASELITRDLNEIWHLNVSSQINDNRLVTARNSIVIGVFKRDKKIEEMAIKQGLVLNPSLHPQGYYISINVELTGPGKILLLANTPAGVLYAAQTFRQLITKDHQSNQIIVPSVFIQDWPIFDYRGLNINIYKSDTEHIKIEYLKNVIPAVAFYKMNILCLQTNTSPKAFGMAALSDEEIKALVSFAKLYQIELVGNISIVADSADGHAIGSPASGGNSLGKKDVARHHCSTNWCGHLNKNPLIWGDVSGETIARIPKTAIVMNNFTLDGLNKSINDHYDRIEGFRKEGLSQIICPQPFLPEYISSDISLAHKNIYDTALAGLRHLERGHYLMGLVISDDLTRPAYPKFLESIIEPIVFSAECAWIPDRIDEKRFQSNFTRSLFGIDGSPRSSESGAGTLGWEVQELLSSCTKYLRSGGPYPYTGSRQRDRINSVPTCSERSESIISG